MAEAIEHNIPAGDRGFHAEEERSLEDMPIGELSTDELFGLAAEDSEKKAVGRGRIAPNPDLSQLDRKVNPKDLYSTNRSRKKRKIQ